jgi:hypothetical protein
MPLAVGHDHLNLEGVGLKKVPPSIGRAAGQLRPFSPIVTDGSVHKYQCGTERSCDAGVTDSAEPVCTFGALADRGVGVACRIPVILCKFSGSRC